ncbi:hypothetical protein BDV32DRAFT_152945 [Aspergillus pseudonomiae]|nr:hypothetical protein BDV32DRAFT_152945 [Aspergillus pseudonomiae]
MSDTSTYQEPAVTRQDGTEIMEEADVIGSLGTASNQASGNNANEGLQPPGDTNYLSPSVEDANALGPPGTVSSQTSGNNTSGQPEPSGKAITSSNINQLFPSMEAQVTTQPSLGPNIAALPSNLNATGPTMLQPPGNTIASSNINQLFPSMEAQVTTQPSLGPNIAALPSNLNATDPTMPQNTQQPLPLGPQVHVQPNPSNIAYNSTSNSHQAQGGDLSEILPDAVPFDDDGFATDAGDSDAGSDTDLLDEDNKRRKDLKRSQKIAILHKIAELPSEDITRAMKMIHEAVPEGYGLSLMDFGAIVHQDKWTADKDNYPRAQEAFKRLQLFLNILEQRQGELRNKKDWLLFHSDKQENPDDTGKGLRRYHFVAHRQATEYLKVLFSLLTTQDSEQNTRKARSCLDMINKEIEKQNRKNKHSLDLGKVDYSRIEGLWRAIKERYAITGHNQNVDDIMRPLRMFCEHSHYPRGWKTAPPTEDLIYELRENYWGTICDSLTEDFTKWYKRCLAGASSDEYKQYFPNLNAFNQELAEINRAYQQAPESHCPPVEKIASAIHLIATHVRNRNSTDYKSASKELMTFVAEGGYPCMWVPELLDSDGDWKPIDPNSITSPPSSQIPNQPGGPVPSYPETRVDPPDVNNVPVLNAPQTNGRHRMLAFTPHVSQRCIKPGYTSTGERIHYVQPLGNRANFVVETQDQKYRLIGSAAAGGRPAIEGAKAANVQQTVNNPSEIQNIRTMVQIGGQYGLFFVAAAPWDPASSRLPWFVVGFYYNGNGTNIRVAISRSNLGKILSPKHADGLIVEGIVGSTDMSLREALESQVAWVSLENQRSFPQEANFPPVMRSATPAGVVSGPAHSIPLMSQSGAFPPAAQVPKQRQSLPWEVYEPWWFQAPRTQQKPQKKQTQKQQQYTQGQPQIFSHPQYTPQQHSLMQSQYPYTQQQVPYTQQQATSMQQLAPLMQQLAPYMQQLTPYIQQHVPYTQQQAPLMQQQPYFQSQIAPVIM